jgi:hypothetical protein
MAITAIQADTEPRNDVWSSDRREAAMNATTFIKVDKTTFFRTAERHEGRCEFVRGQVIMQQGGTFRHSLVAKRIIKLLDRQLDAAEWVATGADRGVDTGDMKPCATRT